MFALIALLAAADAIGTAWLWRLWQNRDDRKAPHQQAMAASSRPADASGAPSLPPAAR